MSPLIFLHSSVRKYISFLFFTSCSVRVGSEIRKMKLTMFSMVHIGVGRKRTLLFNNLYIVILYLELTLTLFETMRPLILA